MTVSPESVTVVIPTYNRARFLGAAIDSVLSQLLDGDELVVVDDGSTDGTPEVLACYGDRLRVVRTENGGLGAARNVGVSVARRSWIAFHDSDDVARPDRLSRSRTLLRRHVDVDVLLANGEYMGTPGAFVVPRRFGRDGGRSIGVRELFDGFPIYFQSAFVRRATFAAAGPFDPALRVHTDLDCGYRLVSRGRTLFVDEAMFDYRWHGTNITADRVAGRDELARILARLLEEQPALARAIGVRRIKARLARHYFRLARTLAAAGRTADAVSASVNARRLRPFHPRYRLLRVGAD